MNGFILRKDADSGHTLVPDFFLDNYMPGANGEYVKIYLYLLRCLKSDTQELSISLIADKFEHTESDVCRALKYWEKRKLLKLEYDASSNLTGVRVLEHEASEGSPGPRGLDQPEPEKAKKAAKAVSGAEDAADAKDTKDTKAAGNTAYAGNAGTSEKSSASGRIPTDLLSPQEAQQLLFICEQYLGKTLSSREVAQILDLHDSFGFSAELIEYLVEYCVSGGHKSIHYIEGTARGWHEAGIRTVSQARQQTTTYNRAYYKILKAFGISNRNPVDVEISYMNKWLKTYGFSLELITEACSRTMAAIHQPGFEYADKILSGWKKNHVASLADLEALDQSRRSAARTAQTSSQPAGEKEQAPSRRTGAQNRFHNFKERDYDFEKLQKQLINQ